MEMPDGHPHKHHSTYGATYTVTQPLSQSVLIPPEEFCGTYAPQYKYKADEQTAVHGKGSGYECQLCVKQKQGAASRVLLFEHERIITCKHIYYIQDGGQ